METMETKVNTTNETESAAHQTGMMDIKDFDYDLPEELIAQDPLSDRSSSRLMVLDKETGEICKQSISLPASPIRGTELLIIGHDWQTAMHLVIQSPLWERLMESLSEKATAMQAELDAARCRGAVVENIEFGRNSDAHGRSVRSLSGEVDCFVPTIKNRDSNDHVHVDDVLHAISADDFNKRIIHSDSKITE